jgi:starch-binding outer membrane protein, SusD/RagB family
MRAYIKTALGLAGMAALTGCMDLEEKVVTGVTTSYYETQHGLEDAVNGAYATLRTFYGSEQGMALSEQGTDLFRRAAGGTQFYNLYNAQLNPSHSWLQNVWENLYHGINTANAVVERSGQTRMDPQLREQRVAEVRFLRALKYFLLVQTWGDIHLTLDETRGVQTETPRHSKAEVYEAIIADLQFAEATLPAVQSQWGRATKGAAQHLLAKVYLTRAAPGDMGRAAELAQRVIASGHYRLLPRFMDVFQVGNERNDEAIFAVRYSSNPLTNRPGNQWHLFWNMSYDEYVPGLTRSIEYGRMFVRLMPTPFLLNLFDREIDSRYDDGFRTLWRLNTPASIPAGRAVGDTAIYMPGYEVPQSEIDSKPYLLVPPSKYEIRLFPVILKHLDPTRPTVNEANGHRDLIVMRLAETYLIAAEALMRDGRTAEAVPYVNAVRRRAAKPGSAAAMEVTTAQLDIDFILNERGRELAAEGMRWFDLVRTDKLVERVRAHNPEARSNIQPHHTLRPIPQTAIDRTTAVFPQNPGY